MSTEFKKGERVVLLSIPFGNTAADDETTDATGRLYPGVGETHTIDHVRNYPHGTWYDVAGWVVQARNLRKAD